MEPRKKRLKKPNFTDAETVAMLEEISIEKTLLLSHLMSSVTNRNKEIIWNRITEKINMIGGYGRKVEQVKKRWKDLKSAVLRKRHASSRGGDVPLPEVQFEEMIETILAADPGKMRESLSDSDCQLPNQGEFLAALNAAGEPDLSLSKCENPGDNSGMNDNGSSSQAPEGFSIAFDVPVILSSEAPMVTTDMSSSVTGQMSSPATTAAAPQSGNRKTGDGAFTSLAASRCEDRDKAYSSRLKSDIGKFELKKAKLQMEISTLRKEHEESETKREILDLQRKKLQLEIDNLKVDREAKRELHEMHKAKLQMEMDILKMEREAKRDFLQLQKNKVQLEIDSLLTSAMD